MSEMNDKNSNLKKLNKKLKEKLETIMPKHGEITKNQNNTLHHENRELKIQISVLEHQMSKEKTGHRNRVQHLIHECKAARQEIGSLRQRVNMKTREEDELQNEISSLKFTSAELQEEIENQKRDKNEVLKMYQALKARVSELESTLEDTLNNNTSLRDKVCEQIIEKSCSWDQTNLLG